MMQTMCWIYFTLTAVLILGDKSIKARSKQNAYSPHSQVQQGMSPFINMQKSVFLPLWDNHGLYGSKILHIESFSAKESENLVRIAKFFV